MRRVVVLVALLALIAGAAGCSGRDAREAQTLLAQSEAAVAEIRSATFSAKLWTEGGPQQLSFTMSGGAYAKGKHAGDFYVIVSSSEDFFDDIVLVQRAGKMSASMGGQVVSAPIPATSPDQSFGLVQLDPYVKDVDVEHGKIVDGESTTSISGVVDMEAFLEGSLGAIPELAGLGDAGFDGAEAFGDTRAVFYISDSTYLPVRALVDLPIDVLGEEVVLHMDFAYTSFNKRLTFPNVR